MNWDTKWRSAVKNYEDRWVGEFAIPLKSIRYKEGATEWGINFSRLDLKTNEKTSWAPVPRQFQSANLGFTGTVKWDKPLPKKKVQYSIIPYVSGSANKDVEAMEAAKYEANAGLDAKILLSSSLNLDLTINPDYSNVEVDQQIVNLDRFELFFPEKRQFFLENSDLFANLGSDDNRPFFSRRIGLNVPVIAGARLSGKLNQNWRIGAMNMQTAAEDTITSTNFSVAVFQRKIFQRSNISFFMINKQLSQGGEPIPAGVNNYNRVLGIDYNLASADSKWTGKFFYHHSLYPNAPAADAFTASASLVYDTQSWRVSLENSWIGTDYLAETGFIRRRGNLVIKPSIGYKIFPQNSTIANHGPTLNMDLFLNEKGSMTDRFTTLAYQLTWLNTSKIEMSINDNYIQLLDSFDPTNSGGNELESGSKHNWRNAKIDFRSDGRKLFNYKMGIGYGGYFNGTRSVINGEVNYRVQPYGNLGVIMTFNDIILPEPYSSAKYTLIGPKLDVTFTRSIFLTTYAQYNNQIDNMNVNVRFQWRYAPGSDIFIVYTNNTSPDGLGLKNNGLVAKISYWFN